VPEDYLRDVLVEVGALPTVALLCELARLEPALRDTFTDSDNAGPALIAADEELAVLLPPDCWPQAVAALRSLDNDAGWQAAEGALAPFAYPAPSDHEGCRFCGAAQADRPCVTSESSFGIRPSAVICERCVRETVAMLSEAELRDERDRPNSRQRCSFCAAPVHSVAPVRQGEFATICRRCAVFALDILSDALPR